MTVSELIKELQKAPGRTVVLLASDAEGNSFRLCHQMTAQAMVNQGRGEFEMHPDENAPETHIVLWPA